MQSRLLFFLLGDPNTVWLRNEINNKAHLPDEESGSFDLCNENFEPSTAIYVGGSNFTDTPSSATALIFSATS